VQPEEGRRGREDVQPGREADEVDGEVPCAALTSSESALRAYEGKDEEGGRTREGRQALLVLADEARARCAERPVLQARRAQEHLVHCARVVFESVQALERGDEREGEEAHRERRRVRQRARPTLARPQRARRPRQRRAGARA